MIVVNIMGGLGNQLFMYAMYRRVLLQHKECYIDIGWFKNEKKDFWYPYQLERLGLNADILERDEYCVREYYISKNHIKEADFEKQKNSITVPILNLVTETDPYSCDRLWERDNAYLYGYFQNIHNCENVLRNIRDEIIFPQNNETQCERLKARILQENSVAVHIRLNDYEDFECFERTCPREYYLKAISYIAHKISDAEFYIFSNNIERAKTVLGIQENFHYVDYFDRMNGIGDMELITLCKHVVIGNSTFGWWGAALNKKPEAIIIAPERWNDNVNGDPDYKYDLCLKNWISF